jgi:hypothetical protein
MDYYESYFDGISDCCGKPMNTDIERCSYCGENCLPVPQEDDELETFPNDVKTN